MSKFDDDKAAFAAALDPMIDSAYQHLSALRHDVSTGDLVRNGGGGILTALGHIDGLMSSADSMAHLLHQTDPNFLAAFDAAARALHLSRDDDDE